MKITQTDCINDILPLHSKIFGFDFPISSYYKKKQSHDIWIFLYTEAHRQIGYSIVVVEEEKKNLYAWYGGLIPEFQGMGLNTIFLDYLIDKAKELDYHSITLATTNKRPHMIIQAVRKGFEIYDLKKRDTGEGNKIYFIYHC